MYRRTKRKKVYVISTFKRPVPLVHHLYTGNNKQTSDQLFVIVGEDHKFNSKRSAMYWVIATPIALNIQLHLVEEWERRNDTWV